MTLLFLSSLAIFLFVLAIKWERILYLGCRFVLQKVSSKLLAHKALLFFDRGPRAFMALDELLALTKKSSFLLQEWAIDKNEGVSSFQLCAYVDECWHRSLAYFEVASKGQKDKVSPICFYSPRNSLFRGSCYFCSAPILFPSFNKSVVSSVGSRFSVSSCSVCQKSLKNTDKVSTLYFFKKGKRVHWAEYASYKPKLAYWDLNGNYFDASEKRGATLLRLVHNKKK